MSDFAPNKKATFFIVGMCLVFVVTFPVMAPILYAHEVWNKRKSK